MAHDCFACHIAARHHYDRNVVHGWVQQSLDANRDGRISRLTQARMRSFDRKLV